MPVHLSRTKIPNQMEIAARLRFAVNNFRPDVNCPLRENPPKLSLRCSWSASTSPNLTECGCCINWKSTRPPAWFAAPSVRAAFRPHLVHPAGLQAQESCSKFAAGGTTAGRQAAAEIREPCAFGCGWMNSRLATRAIIKVYPLPRKPAGDPNDEFQAAQHLSATRRSAGRH